MDACTIIAKNYLAQARVLATSFREHHPDGRFYTLVIDEFQQHIDPAQEPFELLTPRDLHLDAFDEMAAIYDVLELSTAVKPSLLRYLMHERSDGPVAYLDPDIKVFDSLGEIDRLAREHGLVLTPHTTEPLPADRKMPSETDIMKAGTFNLGFVAMSPGREVDALIDWWEERLRYDCIVKPGSGLFVDQRWIDMAPGMLSDLAVLRDPGYNVAYWNLPHRSVELRGDRYFVNGSPLRFFHYSGFDPKLPHIMSKHQNRIELRDHPVLRDLFAQYAHDLLSAGVEAASEWPYTYDLAGDGTRLTPLLRGMYRNGVITGALQESVFTKEGAEAFLRWLEQPADKGANVGITRFLWEVYRERPDLRATYPDLDGPDGAGFAGWALLFGINELDIPKRMLPPAPEHVRVVMEHEQVEVEPDDELGGETDKHQIEPWGVNVAGYLRSELGVGEAARLAIRALDAAGIESMPVQGQVAHSSRQGHDYAFVAPSAAPFPVNLICVNADGLPQYVNETPAEFFEGRYQVGMWWWEVQKFPERWTSSFDYLDEVWVGTRHIQDALSPVSPIPVVRIRLPVEVPPIAPRDRTELGLPDGFLFLFVFDFLSVLERKNPKGLIEAFKTAFPRDVGASLVIKSINAGHYPEKHEELAAAVGGHPNIHIIDRYVSANDKNAMIANADCYASLHRSEGFGLTLAEAMYLGKPVIATNYSGNLDYMTPANSYLVDWSEIPIGESSEPYPSDGTWAGPDTDHAAHLMREVFENPEAARLRGERAAADIRRTHSAEAAGEIVKKRVAWIKETMTQERGRRTWAPNRINFGRRSGTKDRIRMGPKPPQDKRRSRVTNAARKLILRLIRPYTSYQRDLMLEMNSRLEYDIPATHASIMRTLREVQEEAADLRARVGKAELLVEATQAHPTQASLRFRNFVAPGAGRVYGYRLTNAGASEDESYRTFEDIFRGSEQMIRERQRRYLDVIGNHAPVLDVGCGRGELLDLLREAGTPYAGIDTDRGMVDRCRSRGHEVHLADANSYLEQLPDHSQGVIFSAQVIEHMPAGYLEDYFRLAQAKLKPGGLCVSETVNPHSARAMKAFWVDLTHQHPIFPEVALALCYISGFPSGYVFHPNGTGNPEEDQYTEGEYAVVATASGAAIGTDDGHSHGVALNGGETNDRDEHLTVRDVGETQS